MSETSDDIDLYALLGVRSDATFTEIKKAWRIRALMAYPEEWMKNLNKAKITLFDPVTRAEYDYKHRLYNLCCKYNANKDTIFTGLKRGEKLSEMFQRRFHEWINEFHTLNFVDNFDNGKIYKSVFEHIEQLGADLRNRQWKTAVSSPFDQSEEETVKDLRGWMHDFCANKDGYLKKISIFFCKYRYSVIKQLYDRMRIEREIFKDISIIKEFGNGSYLLRFDAALLLLKGHYLGCKSNYKASLKAFQDAVMLLPSEEVHFAVACLLYPQHIKAMIDSLAEEVTVNDVFMSDSFDYCDQLESCSPLMYGKARVRSKSLFVDKALHYIDLCMNLPDSTMVCSISMLASIFFFQEMKLFQVSSSYPVTLREMYALRNSIRDLCVSTTSRAKTLINPFTQLHYIKMSFNLSRLSNDRFRSAFIASRQLNSCKFAKMTSHLVLGNKPILEDADKTLAEELSRSVSRLHKWLVNYFLSKKIKEEACNNSGRFEFPPRSGGRP